MNTHFTFARVLGLEDETPAPEIVTEMAWTVERFQEEVHERLEKLELLSSDDPSEESEERN